MMRSPLDIYQKIIVYVKITILKIRLKMQFAFKSNWTAKYKTMMAHANSLKNVKQENIDHNKQKHVLKYAKMIKQVNLYLLLTIRHIRQLSDLRMHTMSR